MSDDWRVGDLAVCVDDGPHPWHPHTLTAGSTYQVAAVMPPMPCAKYGGRVGTGLHLTGVSCASPSGFAHERFRKIRPDELTECEPEFVTLLKRSKRKVGA